MNLLYEQPPHTVKVCGEEYPINWDFATSVEFEVMMQDDSLGDEEKLIRAFSLYYPEIPPDPAEALEQLLWFYRGGDEPDEAGQSAAQGQQGPVYSFSFDHEYIYAAFMDQYGIDLQTVNLHWWCFRALFKGLREDNQISKIIGYRSVKITGNMSDEQRSFYRSMKKLYQIPQSKLLKKKASALEEVLLGSGNLSDLSK